MTPSTKTTKRNFVTDALFTDSMLIGTRVAQKEWEEWRRQESWYTSVSTEAHDNTKGLNAPSLKQEVNNE